MIGHPKDNAPAYGWVEGLERKGDTLWAEILPTVAQFSDWLKAGLFKKRSISLYPDMSLRHVGFLGAMPPAVKGLPDASFKEGAETAPLHYDFDEGDFVGAGLPRPEFSEEDKAAQEARSKKYGIGIKGGGNVTKPSKYKDIPDNDFADPVNYRYPVDGERIHAALVYWGRPKDRQQYFKKEVEKVTRRILDAAKKHGVEVDESKWKFSELPHSNHLPVGAGTIPPSPIGRGDGGEGKKGGSMNFWEELKGFLKGKGIEVDNDSPGAFSEADVKAAVATAVEKVKAEIDSSFAERDASFAEKESSLKAKESELTRWSEEIKNRTEEARKIEVAEFCEALKKDGILTPAMEKLGMGITGFMQAISGIETTFEFAEKPDAGPSSQRPFEFMRAFLLKLPKAIEFREVARAGDDPEDGALEDRRERAIQKHMDDNKTGYKTAVLAVAKDRPELFGRE